MTDAIRQIGVSEVTFYRWRQEYGGLKIEQVRRLREFELENSRLRKAVSEPPASLTGCRPQGIFPIESSFKSDADLLPFGLR